MGKTIHLTGGGKIELIDSGFIEMLHEVGNIACKEQAEKIASRCGDGYAYKVKKHKKRTVATVYTDTIEAAIDNGANNTLAKAVR